MHYSGSNTSGEKAFEEFYTDSETVDFARLRALGIVTGKQRADISRIETLFAKLNAVFSKENTTKEEVVEIMAEYLPNFEHIETGKSLDSKM